MRGPAASRRLLPAGRQPADSDEEGIHFLDGFFVFSVLAAVVEKAMTLAVVTKQSARVSSNAPFFCKILGARCLSAELAEAKKNLQTNLRASSYEG